MRLVGGPKGTVEFRHDAARDIVFARPRWTLGSVSDVSRWYQVSLAYFSGRFSGRKDIVVQNDEFDVTPQLATLWGQYRALLHESRMGIYVGVGTSSRVQLASNTSSVQHGVHTYERTTAEEAVELILSMRSESARSVPPVSAAWPVSRGPKSEL